MTSKCPQLKAFKVVYNQDTIILLESNTISYWEATLYLTGKQHYILLGSNTISLLKTNIFLFTLLRHSFSYSCYSTQMICKCILYSVLYPSKSIISSYFTKGFNRIYIKTLEKQDRVECTIYTTSSTDVHNSLDT